MAVIKAAKYFRPYLYGQHFKHQMDHVSLRWLCLRREPFNQLARWLEILAKFKYALEHRAGCRQCKLIEISYGGHSKVDLERPNTYPDSKPASAHRITDPSSITPTNMKDMEAEGNNLVDVMHQAIRPNTKLSTEQTEIESKELNRLDKQRSAPWIRPDGILKIRVAPHNNARWCIVHLLLTRQLCGKLTPWHTLE